MKRVRITIDGRDVTARVGQSLLGAALDNGVYIPNLCHIPGAPEPAASCRLCFVEVEGKPQPVTACTETVVEGMQVETRGEKSLKLVKAAFELLMASHDVDCAHCAANGTCELQTIAKHLKVKLDAKRFRKLLKEKAVDDSHPAFSYDPDKCVLCGKCVHECREHGNGTLGFARRGFDRTVSTFMGLPFGESGCEGCAACAVVCPTGAMVVKEKK